MKRLFIAIKIAPDPDFLLFFRSLKNNLSDDRIRWVEEHNLHITLKFLGETPEQLVPKINDALSLCVRNVASFTFQLKGVGVFGSRYAPRVIWTGLEPFSEIVKLMDDIQRVLVPAGFEKDHQNHVPHLTLGRISTLTDLSLFQRVLEQNRGFSSSLNHTDCIILYESILKRGGPEYRVLQKYLLGKKDQN